MNKSKYKQQLFSLWRGLDEQQGGDHAFEILIECVTRSRDPGFLEYLLQQGFDINMFNEEGRTPLFWVIGDDDLEAAQLLLDAGADPNRYRTGEASPLMYAAHRGSLPMVNLLCSWGAAVDYQDRDGDTALSVAAAQGHRAIVEQLQAECKRTVSRQHGRASAQQVEQ